MRHLYLVTDEEQLRDKDLFQIVEAAIKGGVTMVQLREKASGTREFIERAIRLKQMLTPCRIPLIINDRVDVALASDADGVHIGQSDMPYAYVKQFLPAGKLIGLSVESREQALEANAFELAYIAASPVFATPTKTNTVIEWGLEGVRWIKSVSRHPVIAIGNLKTGNIPSVIEAGANGIAVVSAIISSPDPESAARELARMI